jgi:hypothetical protein
MKANDKDRLDRWLGSTLQQYGNVQPRAGLESRVIANLEARSRLVRRRWALSFATVTALCTLSLGVWLNSLHRNDKGPTIPPPVLSGNEIQDQRQTTQATFPQQHVFRRHQVAFQKAVSGNTEIAQAPPHLEQFPSQRSLSEQEQLLLTYVRRFPKEAVEVANEQAERERELDALYSNGTTESNFDQER